MSEPLLTDAPERERFEVHVDGELAGFLAYKRNRLAITLIHTEVDASFEGQGLASRLAVFALDAARAESLDVIPVCPFVRSYISRHVEYLDLVPAKRRAEFDLPAGS